MSVFPKGQPSRPKLAEAAAPGAAEESSSPLGAAAPVAPLRVALDVRVWRMSGLGTYVRELLREMARLELPVDWTLIGPRILQTEIPPGLAVADWIDLDRPIYDWRATIAYPRLPKGCVLHYPHYNFPWRRGGRAVVTVFDLFHLHYGSWSKREYQMHFMRRLRWSRATVLAASPKTADELEREIGIPRQRIRTIPLGPGVARMSDAQLAQADSEARKPVKTLAGQTLRPPWLLANGIDQPHKNFDFLLSALGLYYQRRPDAPPLVWAGLDDDARLRRSRALPASLRERVALEPPSSQARLEGLYGGAAALIFPSLDEGFGLPPLEAMLRGVPVICSRREPMLSILGGAPLYFEPTESASLWRMIDRVLDAPDVVQEVVRRSAERAREFSWERCARETFEAYGAAIAGNA